MRHSHCCLRFLVAYLLAVPIPANTTAQNLPFSQDWSNTNLITAEDDWSGVPGIAGYRGDDLTTATGTDPQTILADGTNTPIDVLANQTNPNTLATGGVAEFEIADPVVALNGSGTADAPFLLINISTLGQSGIQVSYLLRDLDASADNSIQQVALHYRVGNSGTFTNIPAGYVADATTGPNLATLVTPVNATLPPAADNQPLVQLRIMTTNAVGNDEWVGVDNISITATGGPTPLTLSGAAAPASIETGQQTLLTATVQAGANPASTGIAVTGNLTGIGGSAAQTFFNDGTNGDILAGDNVWSYLATATGSAGIKNIPLSASDLQGRAASGSISLTLIAAPCQSFTPISAIQGAGASSPIPGALVETRGIVTALRTDSASSRGFFLQSATADADADPNTSEGILVFTGSSLPAAAVVGNLVCVAGRVTEFVPAADPFSPPVTELTSPSVTVLSAGNPLPAPVTLSSSVLTPGGGLEQLEKFEGMRVRVDSLTVVGPSLGSTDEAQATSTSNGVFFGVLPGTQRPFREPGIQLPVSAPGVPSFDANPEILRVDSDAQPGALKLDVSTGATVANLTGPLDYSFRAYTILPDPVAPAVASGNLGGARPVAVPEPQELTIASINLERLYDTENDPATSDVVVNPAALQNRLNKIALAIRDVYRSPDIIGVSEAENLGVLQALALALGGYTAYLAEGNDVGGIDVGFLVKNSRVTVKSVTQVGKDATFVNPGGATETLNDRPPLVLEALVRATPRSYPMPVTVIANHLRSLNGIEGATGERVRAKRKSQAEFLANLIQSRQAANPREQIVSIGDYNAFQFSDGYVDVIGTIRGIPSQNVTDPSPDLVNPDLLTGLDSVPAEERYSYVFNGSAQVLDHILYNQAIAPRFIRMAFGRNNADFPEGPLFRNVSTRPERYSDHDVPVAYFRLPAALDVTDRTGVEMKGLHFVPARKTYEANLIVKNTSPETIQGPIAVILKNLPAGVTLANADGALFGDPYVTLKANRMVPNQSAPVQVDFLNPSNAPIAFTAEVVSGPLP